MEAGVEIKRVGWVFVGGDYHYSNATKPRCKLQLQQKWRERLVCGTMSVNICQKAGAKRLHLFDAACAFLLVHIKSSLSFGVRHMAERAMTGHGSKNTSRTKQRLLYYIELCNEGIVMATIHRSESTNIWVISLKVLKSIDSGVRMQLCSLFRKMHAKYQMLEKIVCGE